MDVLSTAAKVNTGLIPQIVKCSSSALRMDHKKCPVVKVLDGIRNF